LEVPHWAGCEEFWFPMIDDQKWFHLLSSDLYTCDGFVASASSSSSSPHDFNHVALYMCIVASLFPLFISSWSGLIVIHLDLQRCFA
jgi:hypothetical protein